jgi:molybdenum cofactor synthesis domain-containing protein
VGDAQCNPFSACNVNNRRGKLSMENEWTGAGPAVVSAALIVIGDEILSGRTKDKNIGHIADHLTAIGIQLKEVRIVPDEEEEIIAAVNALRARYDYVFTTGGIGPTHDDITADSVAKAFGVGIDVDERALAPMRAYFERRGVELTPARMRMARIPFGAELVENSVSIAPGFMLGNVIVMAGIPNIMQVMLEAATRYLKTGKKMLSAAMDLHRPEGEIADLFAALQKRYPDVPMGSYPFQRDGKPGTQLVLRSTDPARLSEAENDLKLQLAARGWI